MKKIAVSNLGCSKNLVDGENIKGLFSWSGYIITEDFSEAEIIIVNTCAFIKEAKEETIDAILEAAEYKKTGRCSTLIVSGCFSERYRKDVKEQFTEVDLWIGVKDWKKLLTEYFHLKNSRSCLRYISETSKTQYIKISEGCSRNCSFCVIPSIRGNFKSRTISEIIKESKLLSEMNIKECILISQDTSSYGKDIGSSLTKLLEMFLKKTDFRWIRLMYLHPSSISQDMLELIALEPRICSYFDIPLQHISDPVLKSMRRYPGSRDIYKLIERIRTTVPQAAIRTSFITGYPGESKKDFNQLIKFVEWARFEKAGVFPFSPEEGTAAYTLRPRPLRTTSEKRCEILMDIQREISSAIQASYIGKNLDVTIDGLSSDPYYCFEGRTQWDAPEIDGCVYISDGDADINDIVKVNITDSSDYDLYGKKVI